MLCTLLILITLDGMFELRGRLTATDIPIGYPGGMSQILFAMTFALSCLVLIPVNRSLAAVFLSIANQ